MAANGHSHPPTLSHTGPRNTWSDGTSSLVWHHLATLQNRLILKQSIGRSDNGAMQHERRPPSELLTVSIFIPTHQLSLPLPTISSRIGEELEEKAGVGAEVGWLSQHHCFAGMRLGSFASWKVVHYMRHHGNPHTPTSGRSSKNPGVAGSCFGALP